jgi:hypothetical protein
MSAPRPSAQEGVAPSPDTTSFTVRGSRNGSLVRVTWTRGVLSGDPPTCDLIEVHADIVSEGLADPALHNRFGALYGALPERPLTEPVAAYGVMTRVFDTIREVSEHRR